MDYKLKRFINDWGLDNGELNKKLFKAALINKNLNPDITFLELYNITKKNLIICGTNLTTERTEYFNYINYPNMSVIDAILISCCFPVVYAPIKFNNCLYVDGGVLANYPIEYFEDSSGNLNNVIGFVIDYVNIDTVNNNILTIYNYFLTLTKIIINKNDYDKSQKYINNTVIINRDKLIKNMMNFNINDEIKNNLFKVGYESYENFKNK